MRKIVLIVKCFDEKLLSINKSAVFDPYMKHKKSARPALVQTGVLDFIP